MQKLRTAFALLLLYVPHALHAQSFDLTEQAQPIRVQLIVRDSLAGSAAGAYIRRAPGQAARIVFRRSAVTPELVARTLKSLEFQVVRSETRQGISTQYFRAGEPARLSVEERAYYEDLARRVLSAAEVEYEAGKKAQSISVIVPLKN
jgi:hypothetical protein